MAEKSNPRQTRPAIAWAADARTRRFTHVSREAEVILGYPVDRWLRDARFWQDHIHPEDRNWAIDFCLRNSKSLHPYEFEYRMVAKDGKVVWLWDAVQVLARNGEPGQLFGVMVDITSRKMKEKTLQEQLTTWTTIMTQLPEFLMTITPDGTIRYANRVVDGLELTAAQIVGTSIYDYVPITEAGRLKSLIAKAVETGDVVHYEIVGIGPHQTQSVYSVQMSPVKSGRRVERLTLLARDVTPLDPVPGTC
jgi:two-component system, cell cycle sensor histidine kinase and response regulator CckA